MANIESVEYRKSPRGRPISAEPTDPGKILQIVRLRDEEKMRFRAIGEILGMTTQGSSQLYQKWKAWADAYKKIEAA